MVVLNACYFSASPISNMFELIELSHEWHDDVAYFAAGLVGVCPSISLGLGT